MPRRFKVRQRSQRFHIFQIKNQQVPGQQPSHPLDVYPSRGKASCQAGSKLGLAFIACVVSKISEQWSSRFYFRDQSSDPLSREFYRVQSIRKRRQQQSSLRSLFSIGWLFLLAFVFLRPLSPRLAIRTQVENLICPDPSCSFLMMD